MSWYNDLSWQEKETVAYIDDKILRKAVIIDFEGPKVGDPELVGYLKDGEFKTIFLNNSFASCKSHYNADCMSLDEFSNKIIHDINVEGRFIIGFSSREADVLLDFFKCSPVSWYKDAHKYFKKGVFKGRTSKPDGWGLDGILNYYKIQKTFYGYQKISGYIRYAKQDLTRKRNYNLITKSSKTKLTKAVNYNREDVNCLFKAIEISLE